MAIKYKPQTSKALTWDEIEKHYADLNENGWKQDELLKLIKHIKSSELCNRLFAYTSMDKLVISIYNPIEWNREALHIDFDSQNKNWNFNYFSKPNEKSEFEKKYKESIGIEKFDDFIGLIKW